MMCYVHENLTSDHLFLFLQFQVSKCGDFGCKEETLGRQEEEKVSPYQFCSVIKYIQFFQISIIFSYWGMGINLVQFWLCRLENSLLLTNAYFLQATRCSFTGHLDSDPDSTVYVSGCKSEKENMDITLMSKKVNAMKSISPF